MIRSRKKIVLYFPLLADPRGGVASSKDLLPLSVLTIAGWPDRDGYEVVVIDGNLYGESEAHARVVQACEGALLYGTTGVLGHQVADGLRCTRALKAAHPELPAFIGGWFASVAPELHLATGLYDAVCLGQGEITFRELAQAVEAGIDLEGVPGLALVRDGQPIRTQDRPVVGWDRLAPCPWHLIDIAPYREAQLAGRARREVERKVPPPGFSDRPFFGISYFSSFGCPEACNFCCSPGVCGRRWKGMPADEMLDDLGDLHQRWGFDTVRFLEANWGVSEERVRAFAEGLLERGVRFWWYPMMESSSAARYEPATLDALRDAGMYVVQLGGETGDEETMRALGKRVAKGVNLEAALAMDRRGICPLVTFVIGYPGEPARSMMNTLEEARQIARACPLGRATVWPYFPIPGASLYEPAVEAGFRPPGTLEGWGGAEGYQFRETWPGQLPPEVARARKLYEHFTTLSMGLVRGRVGWWERRARRRIESGDYRLGLLEARAFELYRRLSRGLGLATADGAEAIRPGHQTSVLSRRAPTP